MGKCAWFGAVSKMGYRDRRIGESVAVLYGGELNGGSRATLWVDLQII